MTVALVPFAVNVTVPLPLFVNGVNPDNVNVPVCAPVPNVRVETPPLESLFCTTLPPTLTDPELKAKVASFSLLALACRPVIDKLPVTDRFEIVEVRVVVCVEFALGVI